MSITKKNNSKIVCFEKSIKSGLLTFCKLFSALLILLISLTAGAVEIPDRPGKASKGIAIFPQLQMQYGTFQNFLHFWKDRPLFIDRSHRYKGNNFSYQTEPSVLKDAELVKLYNIAGLTPLGNKRLQKNILDIFTRNKVKGVMIMPGIYPPSWRKGHSSSGIKNFIGTIRLIADSPFAYRINGKAVINSYEATKMQPSEWKELLKKARQQTGDKFLFVADMKIPGQRLYRKYKSAVARGKSLEPLRKAYMDKLQSYLDVCDGIYFYGLGKEFDPDGEYGSHLDDQFFKFTRPIILQLMARPQNHGKILGVITQLGYVNHMSGMVNCAEFGSETFRKSFEAALSLNPDFIVPFEWNEWNENTCFIPSVYKGAGYRRIIRYYQSLIDKKKLQPIPGDKLEIPNMLLSYRYSLKLGEVMRFEFLNIPDGGPAYSYKAIIRLRSANGNVVYTSPTAEFSGGNFKALSFTVPTENFPAEQILLPELQVKSSNGQEKTYKDLLYIRLNATTNTIYQYVRVGLREIAPMNKAEFTVTPQKDGGWRIKGRVDSPEKLASIELLDNRDEIRAIEPNPEFDQNKMLLIQMRTTAVPVKRLVGTVKILNTSKVVARSAAQDGNSENFNLRAVDGGIEFLGQVIGNGTRKTFFAIPRSDIERAIISANFKNYGKFKVKVSDIVKYWTCAQVLPPAIYFRFDRMENQPDIPFRMNLKSQEFDQVVYSKEVFPVFHLRIITDSGKLFRTPPVIAKRASGKKKSLTVFSESQHKPVKLNICADRIPDIKYKFTPAAGAVLTNDYAPQFDGELGGGYHYCQPARGRDIFKDAVNPAPQWNKMQSGWQLRFDGKYQNITFEPETFPRGPFTMEFDVRPASNADMILFRHFGSSPGGLNVYTIGGRVMITFVDAKAYGRKLRSSLKLKSCEWNKVKITHDLQNLTLEVNGKKQSFKLSVRGWGFRGSCFGGTTKKAYLPQKTQFSFFHGDLKRLRIYHNVDPTDK
jgi:hypothetical protein